MLESYKQEISRKRRAAGIFWVFVFSFAIFLYFFFQGYYPSFDFTWRNIFESGGVRNLDRDELVKSFGIINIRVEPRDARIQINREDLSYDEKKMVSYGDYLLSIGKPGYIQDRVSLTIDRDIPYYIDKVRLLPRAEYSRADMGITSVARVGTTEWIVVTSSGSYLMDEMLTGGVRISVPGRHIGEGYFLSNATLTRYEGGTWQEVAWSGSADILRGCRDTIKIVGSYLSCPEKGIVIEQDGLTMSGVTRVEKGYFVTESHLVSKKRMIRLSEAEKSAAFFIERDGIWYIPSGGNLIPLIDQKTKKGIPLIISGLDEVRYAYWVDDTLVIFGKKGGDTFLISHTSDGIGAPIPFPDIPLEEVSITKHEGNTFFKTKGALLFLYNNSKKVEWITEGDIVAVSPIAALYQKDGKLWRASWGE